ncbi:hypothetical protein PIB30_046485 [Stylosanthes scabra]|uniref:Uncharacterized protein n=1 Tax=Stylosanthes scabra TaxID=79078 RepID=A0ABU6VJB2_9FABA|nr:hypothetical protein [Stylosanthes scabra]
MSQIYRRLDQQQEESKKSFEAFNTRMDRFDGQLSYLCYSTQLTNEQMLSPYQETTRLMREMEMQGIPVTMANLANHRQKEEEMRQERMRYDHILQEAAGEKAREANKSKVSDEVLGTPSKVSLAYLEKLKEAKVVIRPFEEGKYELVVPNNEERSAADAKKATVIDVAKTKKNIKDQCVLLAANIDFSGVSAYKKIQTFRRVTHTSDKPFSLPRKKKPTPSTPPFTLPPLVTVVDSKNPLKTVIEPTLNQNNNSHLTIPFGNCEEERDEQQFEQNLNEKNSTNPPSSSNRRPKLRLVVAAASPSPSRWSSRRHCSLRRAQSPLLLLLPFLILFSSN